MAILGIDDFKSKLTGGGARSTLYKATINYPSFVGGDVELSSFLIKASKLPDSTLGELAVPFRGRTLKMAGSREFGDWTTTIIISETQDDGSIRSSTSITDSSGDVISSFNSTISITIDDSGNNVETTIRINNDGTINVIDIVSLVNLILS